MKVLVTGSAGFIGSNLLEFCLLQGWDIIGVDNLSVGLPEMADPARVSGLPGSYRVMCMGVCETNNLTEVLSGCDVVFHMAALARVSFSIDHPIDSDYANTRGTLSVLEAARRANVKRVIFS